jgi:enamine deaminase RidA (YjgF/YER057c/UK114 family)
MAYQIDRWPSGAPGRSRAVAFGTTLWVVSNSTADVTGFRAQVVDTLGRLDRTLRDGGSDRTRLLSVQVLLADIATRPEFDDLWLPWIGDNPDHWPQRSCLQAGLAPGLLVELVAVAARA